MTAVSSGPERRSEKRYGKRRKRRLALALSRPGQLRQNSSRRQSVPGGTGTAFPPKVKEGTWLWRIGGLLMAIPLFDLQAMGSDTPLLQLHFHPVYIRDR